MEWIFYTMAFVVAMLIMLTGVYALRWAIRNRQFHDLDAQSKSIFDDEEPMGRQTDFFPGQSRSQSRQKPSSRISPKTESP